MEKSGPGSHCVGTGQHSVTILEWERDSTGMGYIAQHEDAKKKSDEYMGVIEGETVEGGEVEEWSKGGKKSTEREGGTGQM